MTGITAGKSGSFVVLAGVVLASSLAVTRASADARADVGYTRLQQELGGAMPDGTGVIVTQVEGTQDVNGRNAWLPDGGNAEFAGKSIRNASRSGPGLYSGHATTVGQHFYGRTLSMAPAIDSISAYVAFHWLSAGFLATTNQPTGGPFPAVSTSRVANHSWVAGTNGADSYALRRLDWVIETDEYLQVVGMNNGDGIGTSTTPLLGGAFNAVAVGRSDGLHQLGTAALDATYTAGRVRPDVVVPVGTTSLATPHVAAAAALLIATGHATAALSSDPVATSTTNRSGGLVRNAERSEVVKAALMAGADRVTRNASSANLDAYRDVAAHQSANGLDRRYGAGQLNVRNSYLIVAAGEQGSVEDGNRAAGVGPRGFDYDPRFGGADGSNATGTYVLPVSPVPRRLSVALAWNIDITGTTMQGFNTAAILHDLNLALVDADGATVAASQGTLDNTENLWLVVPAKARYTLRVTGVGAFSWDYAIAWQLVPEAPP